LHVAFRRPHVQDCDSTCGDHEDEELSEHIKFRLFLARQLALMKFNDINKNVPGMGIVKDGT
jgi:hypothetical protein